MKELVTCTKIFRFSAGHRVWLHETKCKYLHGHNYKAEITATAKHLDSLGRVIDFGVMKELIGRWIGNNWDHRTLIFEEDPFVHKLPIEHIWIALFNPTAENMAKFLLKKSNDIFEREEYPVRVKEVKLWETETCFATAKELSWVTTETLGKPTK